MHPTSIQDLGINSVTVFSSEKATRSKLTQALTGLLAATALVGGISGNAEASDHRERLEAKGISVSAYTDVVRDEMKYRQHKNNPMLLAKGAAQKVLNGEAPLNPGEGARHGSEESKKLAKSMTIASTAVRVAIDPTDAAIHMGAKLITGSTTAVMTNDVHHGTFAASTVGGALTAASMGPPGIGFYLVTQSIGTYQYIQSNKLRSDILHQRAIEDHEQMHEALVEEMAWDAYLDGRQNWSGMSETERNHKHTLYVEAAVEHLQDSTKSPWIGYHLYMEGSAGAVNGYLPWYEEAYEKVAQLESARDAHTGQPDSASQVSAQSSFQAFNTATIKPSTSNDCFSAFAAATSKENAPGQTSQTSGMGC